MKIHSFYFFYLLTFLLLIAGINLENELIIDPSGKTVITKGFWPFFIPSIIAAFITGLIYHYWNSRKKILATKIVVLHLLFCSIGLFFTFDAYRNVVIMLNSTSPDYEVYNYSSDSFLLMLIGPCFLLASLLAFVLAYIKAKEKSLEAWPY